MERETVDRLARATGCQVVNNPLGNPMFTMTTHELHVFAEKVVEIVALECMDLVDVGGEFVSRPKLVEKIREHFGVEDD